MKLDPEAKTISFYESQGYLLGKVERWQGPRTFDLWSILDWIAVQPGKPTIGIQVCGLSDWAAHMRKMREAWETLNMSKIYVVPWLLRSGWEVHLIAWAIKGTKSAEIRRKRHRFTEEDFE